MPKFFTRFDRPPCGGVECKGSSRTQPQFRQICDINNIVKRAFAGDATVYRKAGYADLTNTPSDLHDALQQGVDARNAYDALPDAVKAAYPTPEAYYAACHDDKQIENLRKLGVVDTPLPETPIEVRVVNDKPVTPDTGA